MDLLYSVFSVLLFVALVVFAIALAKPTLLKITASRKRIVAGGIIAIVVLGGLLAATEPESVRQARREREQQNTQQASQILNNNEQENKQIAETKEVTETQPIVFATERRDDGALTKGQESIVQDGKNGEKTAIYTVTYIDGKETTRTLKSESVTTQPVPLIISVGTYVAPVAPAPKPAAVTQPAPSASSSVYYKNCTAARAAGPTPIYRGEPGYAAHLDRDGDGIACE